jgi:class 3 adenylate cyclase
VVSGIVAVAVAAAEWTGSGRALDTPTGILWSVVALLGVPATLLGIGLELRRRRQVQRAVPAGGLAGRPDPGPRRSNLAALPTGTVTSLFTDIEGSTRLLQELGDGYAAVRDEHAAIVRQAIEDGRWRGGQHRGRLLPRGVPQPGGGGPGGGRRPAWPGRHEGPPAPQVRVRMGLHTGEGVLGRDDYVGLDVNRAARIAAAGHGGQVLISEATRGLVEHALPDGASLPCLCTCTSW